MWNKEMNDIKIAQFSKSSNYYYSITMDFSPVNELQSQKGESGQTTTVYVFFDNTKLTVKPVINDYIDTFYSFNILRDE